MRPFSRSTPILTGMTEPPAASDWKARQARIGGRNPGSKGGTRDGDISMDFGSFRRVGIELLSLKRDIITRAPGRANLANLIRLAI
jgi:hypothetical protein